MKKIQYLFIVPLFLLICSGVYDIIMGIHYTNRYLYLTEELRNEEGAVLTIGMLISNYFTGAFRGIITIVCGLIGIIYIKKGDIKTWYFVFLGILTLMYVLGYRRFPDTEELMQMLTALLCFVPLSIYKFTCRFHKLAR